MKTTHSNTSVLTLNKLVLLTALSFSTISFANANEAIDKEELRANSSVERIEVLGKKPTNEYRKALKKAEADFYKAYNAKVDNKQYKIVCKKEVAVGSRIGERKCYPNIVLTRLSKEARLSGFRGDISQRNKMLAKEMQKANKEVSDYMATVLSEDPSLLDKFSQVKVKRAQLMARLSQD